MSETIGECEACSNSGTLELVNGMMLCADCVLGESSVTVAPKPTTDAVRELQQLSDKMQRIPIRESVIKGNIKQYTDFFNANTTPWVELEARIQSDESIQGDKQQYFCRAIASQIQDWSKALFDVRMFEVETSANIKYAQQLLTDRVAKLRTELRTEFAANNVTYQPPTVKEPKAPRVKKTVEDRMVDNIMKVMKCSIEEARIRYRNQTKGQCTCVTTPGICSVHAV